MPKAKFFGSIMCQLNFLQFCNHHGSIWRITCLAFFVATIPFCLIKKFKNFSYISFLLVGTALFMIGFFVLDVLITPNYYDSDQTHAEAIENKGIWEQNGTFTNWRTFNPAIILSSIFKFYGVSAFGIEFIAVVFPVRNSMKRPDQFKAKMTKTVGFCIFLTIMITYAVSIVRLFLG